MKPASNHLYEDYTILIAKDNILNLILIKKYSYSGNNKNNKRSDVKYKKFLI